MDIQVTDKEIRVKWIGKTKVCTFSELVKSFQGLDFREQRRQVVNLWDSRLFKLEAPIEDDAHEVSLLHSQSPEWDYEAQEELEFIQGADPYLPLY